MCPISPEKFEIQFVRRGNTYVNSAWSLEFLDNNYLFVKLGVCMHLPPSDRESMVKHPDANAGNSAPHEVKEA